MKNQTRILTLLLVIILILQTFSFSALAFEPLDASIENHAAGTQPSKYSNKYNSGERDVIATTLNGTSADAYYNGSNEYDVLSNKSSTEIKNALKQLMTSTHTKISSYADCRDMAVNTDCENEDGRVLLIYTSYSATRSQYNGWNREHVWPQSLGGNNTSGGGADLHHIRPSDAGVNSSRGNKKYGEAGNNPTAKYGTAPATGVLGGHYNSTYFEPLDNVKGDVARIVLYVWLRWGSAWGADSVTEVFQSVDLLLEWCALDPVDTWELGRNEVVQAYQGNRNVFIDYPEYAWLVFGREVPSNMTTPSGEAKNGGNGGSTTPECTTHKDANGDYKCDNCGAQLEKPACTYHKDANNDLKCDACGAQLTACASSHKDLNRDNYCDICGAELEAQEEPECKNHVDSNNDYKCDNCGAALEKPEDPECTSHVDSNGDYKCDNCGAALEKPEDPECTNHVDSDGDYKCDNCGASLEKPDDPDTPTPPKADKNDFTSIVTKLMAGLYTGEEKFAKLSEALTTYGNLSEEDKVAVSTQYNALKVMITQYNEDTEEMNKDAEDATKSIMKVVAFASAVLPFAALALLGKKRI